MSTLRFIKRHPVTTYYTLMFAISWGSILAVTGPGAFLGNGTLQILNGPLLFACTSLAGVLAACLVHGRKGLGKIKSRLFTWQVGVKWYAIALLTGPLVITGVLYSLSITPAIVAASDKLSLLVTGIMFAVLAPLIEEFGWTGFAIPELRRGYGVLSTGLIVGLLWGAWHYPFFSRSGSPAMVAVLLFSWLPPFRMLMVWVYEHTRSLLVAILMHASIDFSLVLMPAMSDASTATFSLIRGAALWAIVAVVALARPKVSIAIPVPKASAPHLQR